MVGMPALTGSSSISSSARPVPSLGAAGASALGVASDAREHREHREHREIPHRERPVSKPRDRPPGEDDASRRSRGPPAGAGPMPAGGTTDLHKVQASLNRGREDGDEKARFTYQAERVLGSGSFGVVYQAQVVETGEMVAIKKVLQDKRYKNRELQIMQELKHCCIVELLHAFHTPGDKPGESYLNVVMEFCSDTVHQVLRHYTKMRQPVPPLFIQLYTYQMCRGCAHMHAIGVCHRDIKPQNLLVSGSTHALKICDFGSAKKLVRGEPNVAYICSRFYRAPELIFGATEYTHLIDLWSVACVTAELILGQVLFPGDSSTDQLMEIIKVLGTPTRDDLVAMNPNYTEFKFPHVKSHAWHKVFRSRTSPESVDWVSRILQYKPLARPNGLQACTHPWFDDLRDQGTRIPGGKSLPSFLLWFSTEEMALMDEPLRRKLIPEWATMEQGGTWNSRHGASRSKAAERPSDRSQPRANGGH